MCDENLLKLWKLVGFQKILIQNVLTIFSKKKKNCYYYYYYFVENFEPVNYFKKKKKNLVMLFYLKSLLGFLVKILANFLKTCLFFENF